MIASRMALLVLLAAIRPPTARADGPPRFAAGSAERDITPPPGLPLWGYASRHDARATGMLDPLKAVAVVIEAGDAKVAIVGLDLGRAPTPPMLAAIRRRAGAAGIGHVLVAASHTHHGPVIELTDRPGRGRGTFDEAVRYAESLPDRVVDAILAADRDRKPARIGVATRAVDLNRNRQARRDPKPVDPTLVVVRLDDESGRPIAVLVNYAAHPTLADPKALAYSADYPGALRARVEAELSTRCLFLQGAAGDLSARPPAGVVGPKAFGEALAAPAIELARSIRAEAPAEPALAARVEAFRFRARVDLANPVVRLAYSNAFFPELIAAVVDEVGDEVRPESTALLLNGQVAIVAASGEFFSDHAVRLRARSGLGAALFVGYCNGHHMYFPTIEAAAQGGYGTEPGTSLAELGAGERVMDAALIDLFRLRGRFSGERR